MMKLPKLLRKRSGSDELSQLSPRSPKSSPLPSPKSPKRRTGFGLLSPKSSRSNVLSTRCSSSSSTSMNSELEAVFRLFDTNGDGQISREELAAILKCLGDPATEEELARMVSEVDSDGDGFISLEEFIRFNAAGWSSASNAELQAAFRVFDIDRNGFISAEELHRVMVGLGETSLTMEDCGRMIRGVDSNGDGRVDFEEFKVMMMATA